MAQRLKQSGYSTGCSVGDTVPYIICCEQVCDAVDSIFSLLSRLHLERMVVSRLEI